MNKKEKVRQGLRRIEVQEGIMTTRRDAQSETRRAWARIGQEVAAGEVRSADFLSRDVLKSTVADGMVEQTAIEYLSRSDEMTEQVAGFTRAGLGFFRASSKYFALSTNQRRENGGSDAVTRVVVDGQRILLETQRLIVQFVDGLDADEIASILHRHALYPVKTGGLPPGLLRVACYVDTAIQAAFALMEESSVVFAEPDFLEHIGPRYIPTDPDYSQQWHHERIANDRAWDITNGKGIHVAVIDNGFDVNHSDLAFGSLSGWFRSTVDLSDADFVRGLAGMPGGNHGTACAGMIAAREGNGTGGCGVAFGSELSAIACAPDQVQTQSTLARALAFAVRPDLEGVDRPSADILCCSLGPNGAAWQMRQVLSDAIDFASSSGRDGRGAAIFWASTNGNFPISADEVCSHPQVIAVGRSSSADLDDGSGFGDELNFLAPGVSVWLPGQGGIHHATTGTSFAAPAAAGVAALALSVDPSLTATQLRDRLRQSCDKIGPLPYAGGRNQRYGFGRVNAFNSVR